MAYYGTFRGVSAQRKVRHADPKKQTYMVHIYDIYIYNIYIYDVVRIQGSREGTYGQKMIKKWSKKTKT